MRYWRVEPPAFATSVSDLEHENSNRFQALLTTSGLTKLQRRELDSTVQFIAGQDYEIKREGNEMWLPFPDHPQLTNIRHSWILVRNARPRNPSFHHAPMPKHHAMHAERNARLVMTYYHPYTLHEDVQIAGVPHVRDLLARCSTWEEAMQAWIQGKVLCRESQRYIQNFFVVSQMRPKGDEEEGNNSDDIFSDE
eukprot:12430375-Karenia_brevis.AAC.1